MQGTSNFIDPVKNKKVFIILLVTGIVIFVGAGVLGYLYYAKNKSYKNLLTEKNKLLTDLATSNSAQTKDAKTLAEQNKTLTDKNKVLEAANKSMQTSLDSANGKISKATAYNNVFSYASGLIETHNGFDGWTENEHSQLLALSEKTNDQTYVDLIKWAWDSTTVDDITRMTRYLVTTAENITNSLK